MSEARAFLVWVDGHEQHAETVYAHTRGAAKYQKWLDVRDAWSDLPITKMRCRVVKGSPTEPPMLAHVARQRGFSWVRAGQRVRHGEDRGTIVGAGAGSLWKVLWDEDSSWRGGVGFIHPEEQGMEYLDAAGDPVDLAEASA